MREQATRICPEAFATDVRCIHDEELLDVQLPWLELLPVYGGNHVRLAQRDERRLLGREGAHCLDSESRTISGRHPVLYSATEFGLYPG